jgi:hypothetical protein
MRDNASDLSWQPRMIRTSGDFPQMFSVMPQREGDFGRNHSESPLGCGA